MAWKYKRNVRPHTDPVARRFTADSRMEACESGWLINAYKAGVENEADAPGLHAAQITSAWSGRGAASHQNQLHLN